MQHNVAQSYIYTEVLEEDMRKSRPNDVVVERTVKDERPPRHQRERAEVRSSRPRGDWRKGRWFQAPRV